MLACDAVAANCNECGAADEDDEVDAAMLNSRCCHFFFFFFVTSSLSTGLRVARRSANVLACDAVAASCNECGAADEDDEVDAAMLNSRCCRFFFFFFVTSSLSTGLRVARRSANVLARDAVAANCDECGAVDEDDEDDDFVLTVVRFAVGIENFRRTFLANGEPLSSQQTTSSSASLQLLSETCPVKSTTLS
jgi:predicted Zn-ribbon and HTH transcriptional regulator